MNYCKYLFRYFIANLHILYHRLFNKRRYKNYEHHSLVLQFKNFNLVDVSCVCGSTFWRKHGTRELSGYIDRCG